MKSSLKIGLLVFSLILILLVTSCSKFNEKKLATNNSKVAQEFPASMEFDIVLVGGRVIDPETNLDAIRNVGIKEGKIALITEEPISGKESVSAQGLVVSPGFIDLHAHGQNIGDYRMQAMQGVTTMLELESGVLPVGDWYDIQSKKNLPLNYGCAAGWTYARIATFSKTKPEATAAYFQNAQKDNDWKMKIANPTQNDEILGLVQKGLDEGGLGIGINAGYAPGYGQKEY